MALLNVLSALANSDEIKSALIFKGALILDHWLNTERVSLDIDSNMDLDFSMQLPDRSDQKVFLEKHIPAAVTRYFERQNPVRFEVKGSRVDLNPREDHPRGWNAFQARINLTDNQFADVRHLPALTIDIAAPETLSEKSVEEISWNGSSIRAYTLERIAGEKARAFLSTLPSYRDKVKKPGEAVRVKDLYDLTRILEKRPIKESDFWQTAGEEFKLACESRYIDCAGIETFKEDWKVTEEAYKKEAIIPDDTDFEAAEAAIDSIVTIWTDLEIIPFEFPLPTE